MTIINIFLLFILFTLIALVIAKMLQGDESRYSASTIRSLFDVDKMNGHDFEHWCADLLKHNGFSNVRVTPGSGDQGVDITAAKGNQKYAIQCKRYNKDLGIKAIQEVNTGRTIYGCDRAAVMTNRGFTSHAEDAAKAVGVELWGRKTLAQMLEQMTKGKKERPNPPHSAQQVRTHAAEKRPEDHHPHRRKDASNAAALEQARKYLSNLSNFSFSKKGLITQLQEDGFSLKHAQYAADQCGANWVDQAKKDIDRYLGANAYSRAGMIDKLCCDGYTKEEAQTAADDHEIIWTYQAFRAANEYMKSGLYSKTQLEELLKGEGFAPGEVLYAMDRLSE